MDNLFSVVEGWPGIHSSTVKDFIARYQIRATGWYVAYPNETVASIRAAVKVRDALNVLFSAASTGALSGAVRGGPSGAGNRGHPEPDTPDPSCAVCGMPRPAAFRRAAQGREFLRRLLPHVVSAAQFAAAETWVAVALTYAGLQALGVPQTSLDSFPTAFREGMAARAASFEGCEDSLPAHWDAPYGTGRDPRGADAAVRLDAEQVGGRCSRWRASRCRTSPAVQILARDDFAQVPGGRTPFGYKDGISFPQIRGNVQSPIVSPEEPIAAGEFVLGYPGRRRPHGPGAGT